MQYMTPLILKRFLKAEPTEFYRQINREYVCDTYVVTVFIEGYEYEYYTDVNKNFMPESRYGRKEKGTLITKKGTEFAQKATLADLFPDKDLESASASERAKASLWMHLVMKGKVIDSYYDSYSLYGKWDWFPNPQLLHVLICGLDFEKSSCPTISSWESFGGTFVESDKHQGLLGLATCRCEEIENDEIVYTGETFESLIPIILGENA